MPPNWIADLQKKIKEREVECTICHAKIPMSEMKTHMDNHIQTNKLDERHLALFKKTD